MPLEHELPETIVAISTAPGRGGIGIVRLAGPHARAIAEPLLRLRHPLAPGRARFAQLLDRDGTVLDEAVATFFAAPHSYTGEDVVEIAVHGAPVLLDHITHACIQAGARLAEPGEFTRRAFLNGRIDLTQAEAVADLINAQTLVQARLAASQLGGSLSRSVAPVKQQLIDLIAALEAGVDFAEDDLDLMPEPQIAAHLRSIIAALSQLADTYKHGRILREGFRLAIVGRPNAGKSSLFNRLLQRDRAIVTAVPGTTRDPIAERLAIGGIPVELIDTAGLREPSSQPTLDPHAEIEAEGIRRTRATMAEAELVLLVIDATQQHGAPHPADVEILQALTGRPHLVALNKTDLASSAPLLPGIAAPVLAVSALTGDGLPALRDAILTSLTGSASSTDAPTVTSLRQHLEVEAALAGAQNAGAALQQGFAHEFLLLDLYSCLSALDALTGATAPDEILHRIFSNFCIGK